MLESLVWDKVKAMLSSPEIVLTEIRKQTEAAKSKSTITSMDKEIKKIERRLKDYPNQEKRLINAIKTGRNTGDLVLDAVNQVKAEQQTDTEQLSELKQAKLHLDNLAKAEAKLDEFYNSVKDG